MLLGKIGDVSFYDKVGQEAVYSFSYYKKDIKIREIELSERKVGDLIVESFVAWKNYKFLVDACKAEGLGFSQIRLKSKAQDFAKKGLEVIKFYKKKDKYFSTTSKTSVNETMIEFPGKKKIFFSGIDRDALLLEFDFPEELVINIKEKAPFSSQQIKTDFSNIKSDFKGGYNLESENLLRRLND